MKERIKQLRTEVQSLTNQAKTMYAELEEKYTAKGQETPAEEAAKFNTMVDDGLKKNDELQRLEGLAAVDEYVNQPATERRSREGAPRSERKSIGQAVLDSAEYKDRNPNARRLDPVKVGGFKQMLMQRKALYGSADGAGGVLVDNNMEVIDTVRQRPPSVIDLINRSETQVDSVPYLELVTRTNNAAVVSERTATDGTAGNDVYGLKPESNIAFNEETAPVKTIATWVPASRQILADAPRLRDIIDRELAYMVEVTLENQILTGNGTGNNFTGILNWSGIQERTQADTGDRGGEATDTKLDALRRAVTDIRLSFYEATGMVLNPSDAEDLELAKDANGNYLKMYDPVALRVWRVPVVETPAITAGMGLVGNFFLGATLWDRMDTDIRVGEPEDFFLRNAVAILAELRAAFAVTRPLAFEAVTFV